MIRDATLKYLEQMVGMVSLPSEARLMREGVEHFRQGARGLMFFQNDLPTAVMLWVVGERKKNRWTPYATVLFMFTLNGERGRLLMGELYVKAYDRMIAQGARRVKAVVPTFAGACWAYKRACWLPWGVTSHGALLFDTPLGEKDTMDKVPEAARMVTTRPKPLSTMELAEALQDWEGFEWRRLR